MRLDAYRSDDVKQWLKSGPKVVWNFATLLTDMEEPAGTALGDAGGAISHREIRKRQNVIRSCTTLYRGGGAVVGVARPWAGAAARAPRATRHTAAYTTAAYRETV